MYIYVSYPLFAKACLHTLSVYEKVCVYTHINRCDNNNNNNDNNTNINLH